MGGSRSVHRNAIACEKANCIIDSTDRIPLIGRECERIGRRGFGLRASLLFRICFVYFSIRRSEDKPNSIGHLVQPRMQSSCSGHAFVELLKKLKGASPVRRVTDFSLLERDLPHEMNQRSAILGFFVPEWRGISRRSSRSTHFLGLSKLVADRAARRLKRHLSHPETVFPHFPGGSRVWRTKALRAMMFTGVPQSPGMPSDHFRRFSDIFGRTGDFG
jgi:hypothetical protein